MTDFKKYAYADPLNNGFQRMKKQHRMPKFPQCIGSVFAFRGIDNEEYHFGQIIGGGENTRYGGYLLAFYDVTSPKKTDIPDLSKAPLLMHSVEDAGRGFLDCLWEIVGKAPIPEHVYPWQVVSDLPHYGISSYLHGPFKKNMNILPHEPFMIPGVYISTFTATLLCYCMGIEYGKTAREAYIVDENKINYRRDDIITESRIYPFNWRKKVAQSEFFDIDPDASEPFKGAEFSLKFNKDKLDEIREEGGEFKGILRLK